MKYKVTVRRAEKKDMPKIQDLLLQVNAVHQKGRPDLFRKGARKYTDSQLELLLQDDTRPVFVGVDANDQVLGYCFCVITQYRNSSFRQDMKELYIDDLCVDEQLRHSGVGHQIYEAVKQYAKEIGCYHLTLNVWACNPNAMAFYDHEGMQMLKKEMEVLL